MKRQHFRADRTLPPPITSINVAGLLAVLGALVIGFMLWTPHAEWAPALPEASHAPLQRDPSWGALFTISASGTIYVDRQPVRTDELDERVRIGCQPTMRFIASEDALFIEADPELPYSSVLEILERCRAHGGERAVFLTKRNITILDAWTSGSMPSPTEWRRALEEQTPVFLH